jgi:hypothetical protein
MITIGRIPRRLQTFFRSVQGHFTTPAFRHFWSLVVAITVAQVSTIGRLVRLLRDTTHRTNHGEFLWRSRWNASAVMEQIALDLLRSLQKSNAGPCYLILDDTQTLKRAKKMAGVGRLFHHASGTYGRGHTILKVCLYYRGVTIPWGSWLWLKPADAQKQGIPFAKLTQLVATAIHCAALPVSMRVVVLFDCYYLCPVVADACWCRRWHFVSVGKANRNFTVDGHKHKLGTYGRNVLRRSGRWLRIQGLRSTRQYRLAERVGHMKSLGRVKVVFSRRRGERKVLALVTDDLRASMRSVAADYLKRWAIELLIKAEKQQLGLGDYRVLRYRAVVRHLHLVDLAYACLTHLGLKDLGAQGRRRTKVLRLAPISGLKARMRQAVWQEAIRDVVKHSHEKPVIRRLAQLLAA